MSLPGRYHDAQIRALLMMLALIGGRSSSAEPPQTDTEFRKLMPFVTEACAVVKEDSRIFPYRSFTFGPFGLETRKARSPQEANEFRNFYLGAIGSACGMTSAAQMTAHFFCGPECPVNRREHFVRQMDDVRAIAAEFERLPPLRLIAVWAPKGEMRVNDVFVMSGRAREAIPSPARGFVPSGEWKSWSGLGAYLQTIGVAEDAVLALTQHMLAIGLSALLREPSAVRLVGVGVGDNESGVLLTRSRDAVPVVGRFLSDNKAFSIVHKLAPDVYYYETN